MKKCISVIMIVLLFMAILPIYAIADSQVADIKSLSDDELLALEAAIKEEKIERKLVKSAQVGAGSYIVGQDIPVGSYTITDDGKYSMNIFVYNDKDAQERDSRIVNLVLWANGEKTGKIELSEGNILEINGPIVLTVFDGIVWE